MKLSREDYAVMGILAILSAVMALGLATLLPGPRASVSPVFCLSHYDLSRTHAGFQLVQGRTCYHTDVIGSW